MKIKNEELIKKLLSLPPMELVARLISSVENMASEMSQMNSTLERLANSLCSEDDENEEVEETVDDDELEKTTTRFI